ncbi:hypothetical protein PVAP13_9NG299273 [Panicum virgatum]|uniref:Uncharacterized protein n=1 Tax=Panicum virgatum TaxID=38727 RepID=A0A8T0MKS0_PANVG|nr:hypothetical protein PVAP13_9NG299273 [Panicum virgatum]
MRSQLRKTLSGWRHRRVTSCDAAVPPRAALTRGLWRRRRPHTRPPVPATASPHHTTVAVRSPQPAAHSRRLTPSPGHQAPHRCRAQRRARGRGGHGRAGCHQRPSQSARELHCAISGATMTAAPAPPVQIRARAANNRRLASPPPSLQAARIQVTAGLTQPEPAPLGHPPPHGETPQPLHHSREGRRNQSRRHRIRPPGPQIRPCRLPPTPAIGQALPRASSIAPSAAPP